MKIAVTHNEKLYMWVDTVVCNDEQEDIIAILVDSQSGEIIARDIHTIKVIDKDIIL